MAMDRASYSGPVETGIFGPSEPSSYTPRSLLSSATAYTTHPQLTHRPSLPNPIDVVSERQRGPSGLDRYGAITEPAPLDSRNSVTSPRYYENYDSMRRSSVMMEPSGGHGRGAPSHEMSYNDRPSYESRHVTTLGLPWHEPRANLPPLHQNFVGVSAPAMNWDTVTHRYPNHHGGLEHSRPILPLPAPGVMPMYRHTPVSHPPHSVPSYQGLNDGTLDYAGQPRGPRI